MNDTATFASQEKLAICAKSMIGARRFAARQNHEAKKPGTNKSAAGL